MDAVEEVLLVVDSAEGEEAGCEGWEGLAYDVAAGEG